MNVIDRLVFFILFLCEALAFAIFAVAAVLFWINGILWVSALAVILAITTSYLAYALFREIFATVVLKW